MKTMIKQLMASSLLVCAMTGAAWAAAAAPRVDVTSVNITKDGQYAVQSLMRKMLTLKMDSEVVMVARGAAGAVTSATLVADAAAIQTTIQTSKLAVEAKNILLEIFWTKVAYAAMLNWITKAYKFDDVSQCTAVNLKNQVVQVLEKIGGLSVVTVQADGINVTVAGQGVVIKTNDVVNPIAQILEKATVLIQNVVAAHTAIGSKIVQMKIINDGSATLKTIAEYIQGINDICEKILEDAFNTFVTGALTQLVARGKEYAGTSAKGQATGIIGRAIAGSVNDATNVADDA